MIKAKHTFLSLCVLCVMSGQVLADNGGSQGSEASQDLASRGVGEIVKGSADIFSAGSVFTISSVRIVGNFIYLGLRTANDSVITTIKLTSDIAGTASLAVGQMIRVSTIESGYVLYAAGKVIAFVPNQLGKSLIYNQVIL